MRSMTEIFLAHSIRDANGRHIGGSDKCTNHNYGDAYDGLFPDRSTVKLVMEIGITDGSSMLAWREAFQEAHIVGLDITPCSCERGPRLEFHQGDQRNKEECERAATNNGALPDRRFDLIVEDALHQLDATLLTLLWLWPFVKHGGIYVVEEWSNAGSMRRNIEALFPNAEYVETAGPFGGVEPLIVLRKE